jgi:hypothetical protein
MKKGPFKMRNPLLKDIKMYQGDGTQITVDDKDLSKTYTDKDGNKARDYSYTNKDGKKGVDVLYLNKPRKESEFHKTIVPVPTNRPIEDKIYLA